MRRRQLYSGEESGTLGCVLEKRPAHSPHPHAHTLPVSVATCRKGADAQVASCGLLHALVEVAKSATLFFGTDTEKGPASPNGTTKVIHNSCGWFWDTSAVVVSPEMAPRQSRDSPTSVTSSTFPRTNDRLEKTTTDIAPSMLQLSSHALVFIYNTLVEANAWDARFLRGPRSRHGERKLASTYLAEDAVDGWNVVIGAMELARAWAIRMTSDVTAEGDDPHRLDRNTRIRLAVCINLAWKFERSTYSYFSKRFTDVGEAHGWPNLEDGHTRELAFLGYGFLYPGEQAAIGDFSDENRDQVKQLYDTMLKLEVDLISTVPLFSMLTNNVQTRSESLIEQLYLDKEITSAVGMTIRSILPFFVRVAVCADLYKTVASNEEIGHEALVCAASYCVATAVPSDPERCTIDARRRPPLFCQDVRQVAHTLLSSALTYTESTYARFGCYGDASWVGHVYVSNATLCNARVALRSAGVR